MENKVLYFNDFDRWNLQPFHKYDLKVTKKIEYNQNWDNDD